MRVLVTGSAGRIGSRLVRRLLDEGESVTGFDLRPLALDDAGYSEVIGPFDDRDLARDAMHEVRHVVHLGAFMSWVPGDADRLFRANVDGTRSLLEAAASTGVSRLLFASSGEVYPENAPMYQPIDETHPLQPRSIYGLTKLLGEELVRFFDRTASVPSVILRFAHTQDASELLDPDSFFSGPRFFLHSKIRQQRGLGNSAAVAALEAADDGREALVLSRNQDGRPFQMHITDTRDMVEGLILALRRDQALGRTLNLGATEPVDFAAALPLMAQCTGLPLRAVNLPGDGVHYRTSNQLILETLGFEPKWTIERMIDEAAEARRRRMAL